jgi:GT2 family glycosyltransferase
MKIAAITITHNDGYKFNEWCKYYEEYKDEIFMHIIVDNGSSSDFLQKIKNYFTKSIIIERKTNGGCTGAYNDGIRKALEDKSVNAIMLIGNDIKLQKSSIATLFNYLYSNKKLGMVGSIIFKKDSEIIESYGIKISKYGRTEFCNKEERINNCFDLYKNISYVPGGMNLAKRDFYEKVGFQDEALFMYGDERDMFIRAEKAGYNEGVTKEALSWHQHVCDKDKKPQLPIIYYLQGRNRIYLAKKHYGINHMIIEAIYGLFVQTIIFIKYIYRKNMRNRYYSYCKGLFAGIKGNMNNSFVK